LSINCFVDIGLFPKNISRLVAVIEVVSPGNKDSPHPHFTIKEWASLVALNTPFPKLNDTVR
jgi:hypothetical protein